MTSLDKLIEETKQVKRLVARQRISMFQVWDSGEQNFPDENEWLFALDALQRAIDRLAALQEEIEVQE